MPTLDCIDLVRLVWFSYTPKDNWCIQDLIWPFKETGWIHPVFCWFNPSQTFLTKMYFVNMARNDPSSWLNPFLNSLLEESLWRTEGRNLTQDACAAACVVVLHSLWQPLFREGGGCGLSAGPAWSFSKPWCSPIALVFSTELGQHFVNTQIW